MNTESKTQTTSDKAQGEQNARFDEGRILSLASAGVEPIRDASN